MNVLTPNAARAMRKSIRVMFAELRADIAKIRELRTSNFVLDTEEADGLIAMGWNKHNALRAQIRALRLATVQKYSNLSPNAGRRMAAFHASR